jgi:hypothetical protein
MLQVQLQQGKETIVIISSTRMNLPDQSVPNHIKYITRRTTYKWVVGGREGVGTLAFDYSDSHGRS